MYPKSKLICPHLKGDSVGVICGIVNTPVRSSDDADIRLCMSKRYEVCSIYYRLLRETAIKSISSHTVFEGGV
ncbi:MAG: hypothetical protein Q7J70_04825 [Thermodesulfovibrionales bacterium]|nr:hypothetical protein [Thermodesulfovibrionales bacterium]